MPEGPGFPLDWLDPKAGGRATDLDLAVLLVNSYDDLADPPDRLTDLRWLRRAMSFVGHRRLAEELRDEDLDALLALRRSLRDVFEAPSVAAAADLLNPMMLAAGAVPLLVTRPESSSCEGPDAWLDAGAGRRGLVCLQARLPVALAHHVVAVGVGRLGTCASNPCHCAFVDRTRGGTRRYCCSYCNDRAAARAYRRRKSHETRLSDKQP